MDSTKSKVAKRKVSQIGEDSSVKAKKFTKNTRSKEEAKIFRFFIFQFGF
jgi:hypothetical protein